MSFEKILFLIFIIFSVSNSETTIDLTWKSHSFMKNNDWIGLSNIYDESSLKEFREGFNFLFTMKDKNLQEKIITNFFGSSNNSKTVQKMNDKTFFSSIYGNLIKSAAAFGQVNFDSLQVIGAINENDSLEHVLIRKFVTIRKADIKEMEIVTFFKLNGKWKMQLSDRIKSIPSQMRVSLGM